MKKQSIHYGWIVLAVTFIAMLVAAGVRSTPAVMMVPLEQEFGWSRSTISLAVAISFIIYGFSGPFIAALMERFGVRLIMTTAMVLLVASTGLTTLIGSAWQLNVLWGVVNGLATGAMLTVLGAVVANRWFVKNKGLVLGLLTASGATGQLAFLPLLAFLVDALDWRVAMWVISSAALIMIPLILLFIRNAPEDMGLQPYGGENEPNQAPFSNKNNPILAAFGGLKLGLRSLSFWLLAGSFFICGLSTNGLIGTHFIPASTHHGIPEVTAAGMLAMIGVFDVAGTLLAGWLSDRMNNRWLLFWFYSLRGLSLLFLPYALGSSYFSIGVFAIFYGLDWVATVPPTVRLAADIFGKQSASVVYGWVLAAHQLGAAVAAYGGGLLFTYTGDYTIAFLLAGLICMVAALMVLRIQSTKKVVTEPLEGVA